MTIYDISLTISPDLPTWPGDPVLHLQRVSDVNTGDVATLTKIESTVHLGTHLDAPVHFLKGGSGVDALDLNVLIGPCRVIDLPDVSVVTAEALEQAEIPPDTTRLLIRTRNSGYWARGETTFHTDFVGIDRSGAEWIVARGICLIGIDYLSIAPYHDSAPTHEVLLIAGIVPIEGVNLSDIEPGDYHLICLPLKLKDCDGAPARAVLIK